MRYKLSLIVVALSFAAAIAAPPLETKPGDPCFAKFEPLKAPAPAGLLLKPGDRLAICGDSITQQQMYSRIMETYLTVCVPELGVTARQYGWSGERAPGFLARMTNDCLRFSPTIATTCYGMNDHEYRPYEERIGKTYCEKTTAIVQSFKQAGARVVLGSPGCVGKMPSWVKTASGTVEDLNLSLCKLRNMDIEVAAKERVAFADVFWPMFTAGFEARQKYAPDYAIAGKDGVHPGWAGHLVMAYAYLKAMGLDGDLGTFRMDLTTGRATTSFSSPAGHENVSSKPGEATFKSSRYPFCATGDEKSDATIRSGMTLVPFNRDLNRLILIAKNGGAKSYKVTWGSETRSYSAEQLARGVNLAADFAVNPFSDAFKKVDAAVQAKQAYEQKQIQRIFHDLMKGKFKSADEIKDPEIKGLFAVRDAAGKLDREAIVKATEAKRAPLAAAIKTAFVPVTHTIKIAAE
ncbi:MAG: SGNH/GDSL hydrolase family protein [Verrucomicrobia bacterium]|nr:SGNH/GDSL hydrolase family protein [Verrucomicrobiota bacterium]